MAKSSFKQEHDFGMLICFNCVMIAEFRVVLFLGVRNLLRLFCVQRRDVLRLPGLGRNTRIGFR